MLGQSLTKSCGIIVPVGQQRLVFGKGMDYAFSSVCDRSSRLFCANMIGSALHVPALDPKGFERNLSLRCLTGLSRIPFWAR